MIELIHKTCMDWKFLLANLIVLFVAYCCCYKQPFAIITVLSLYGNSYITVTNSNTNIQ